MTGWRLVLSGLLIWVLASAVLANDVIHLEHAEFAASDSASPPDSGWQPQTLPDSWRINHPDYSGFAWYRMRFQLPEVPHAPLALFVPRLSLVGELWLNDSLLTPDIHYDAANGRMGSQMSDTPLHIVLPSGLFRAGENVLYVRLQGDQRIRSGLSVVTIGPTDVLEKQWLQRYAPQVILPYIILVLMAGALCFLVAHALRQKRMHVVQLTLLVGVLAAFLYLAVDMPVSRADQQAIRVVVTTLMYWGLCLVGYRLSEVRAPWFPGLLHVVSLLTLAGALALLVAGEITDRIWMIVWPHLALRMVVTGLLLIGAWRRHSIKQWALGLCALLWIVTQVQSLLILMEWLPWDSFRWSVAGALPFCIVLLFFFAERFILEREEAAKQQRDAIAAERGRILQDMHDGMGAQLITALRLARRTDVDRQQLVSSIEESLQDMRLIVDSLDLTEHDLLPLLGNLRFRLEPRLTALGIQLQWDVVPLPELTYLTSASALAILRIVQEAINNALQHANANLIRISAKPEDGWIVIRISDNGQGFSPRIATPNSRGLSGMRLRAAKLGAQLEMDSHAKGTHITLKLPRTPLA